MTTPPLIQDAPAYDAVSTLWILIAAILVFFMQAGFSVLEAGLVRTKNAGNVLMKNLLDFSSATLGYFVFGDFPDAFTLGGAAIVILSGLYIFRSATRG